MVIAFVLMGLILVATPYLYRRFGLVPPEAKKTAVQKPAAGHEPAQSESGTAMAGTAMPVSANSAQSGEAAPASPGAKPAAPVAAPAAQEFTIDTGVYRVVFSNKGAVVTSWLLKDYKNSAKQPLELVNLPGAQQEGLPFSFYFRGQKPSTDLNAALWAAHPGPDNHSIEFEFSDGHTVAKKTFAFEPSGYLVQYADEVTLNGNGLKHMVQWRGGFGDMEVQSAAGHQETVRYDDNDGKLITKNAKAAKNGPVFATGKDAFAGIEDEYFLAAFLPPKQISALETATFSDHVSTKYAKTEEAYPGVAVGGEAQNQFGVFVGPKEINILKQVNPRLSDVIDWGFFGIIAKPLFFALQFVNFGFVHNYGWSIILLTVVINMALFPLKLTNLRSMRRMQALQPEINQINARYKGIGMRDPKSQQKQQEIMDLYKKNGVNPMGGCIPMLIQIPFLYAFYRVLDVTIEMRYASWLWVGDLSQPEHFAIRALPLIMIASGFLLQKMTPMTGGDPNQQKIMQFMPLMWGFFFWPAASGLVLYWLTSNLVSIGQQWFFNKTTPLPATVVPAKNPTAPAPKGRKTA